MVNLANNGDLRKIVSGGGVADKKEISPLPDTAPVQGYVATASIELGSDENKLVNDVVNQYLKDTFYH